MFSFFIEHLLRLLCIFLDIAPEYCADVILADLKQIINDENEDKLLNDINYSSKKSDKFGIIFV